MASLNINGGRDAQKRALTAEVIQQKRLDVLFLQETYNDVMNEIDWSLLLERNMSLVMGQILVQEL